MVFETSDFTNNSSIVRETNNYLCNYTVYFWEQHQEHILYQVEASIDQGLLLVRLVSIQTEGKNMEFIKLFFKVYQYL